MKNKHGLKIALSIASLGVLFLGIYQFAFASTFGGSSLFQSPQASKDTTTSQVAQSNNDLIQTASVSTGEITFTAAELAKYNGMNGNPAYVAVDGIVYDMTKISAWKNGQHHGLTAGQDLSVAFAGSPHSKSILDQSPIVGKFVTTKDPVKVVDSTSAATVSNNTTNSGSNTAGVITLAQTSTVTTPQTWTLDALSKFNGMNGNPAYIAVNGTIYDVTNIGAWTNGVHHGIHAGQDVSSFFASSPHSASLLNQLPIVGKIGGTISSNTKAPSTTPDATTSATTNTTTLGNSYSDDHENEFDDEHEYDDDHEYDDHNDRNSDHDSGHENEHDSDHAYGND